MPRVSVLHDHEKLLEALRFCRTEAIAARRLHRPRSGMVRSLDSMLDEIDAVAELITARPSAARRLHPKGFVAPCRPTLARDVPDGPQWPYEIKHDGFRFICGARRRSRARLAAPRRGVERPPWSARQGWLGG